MGRILPVLNVLGLVVLIFGLSLVVPIGVSWWIEDGALSSFDEALVLSVGVGALVYGVTRKFRRDLSVRDGFLLVISVWVILPAVASIPLMIAVPGLTFSDAYFEATSGLTATGATVLSGLDSLPGSINLWRTLLHWIGGLGIIVLAVAVLPMLGVGGRQLYRAETPGPMKDTKLTPRIAETAKGFWLIYVGFTIACAVAYRIAGMSWLDAIIHAFSTLALGGFSSHDASIGYFDSIAIESVAIAFMFIAGLSYGTHFLALIRRSGMPYLRDPEAKAFVLILAGSCLGIALYLWITGVYAEFTTALRYAAFNTASVATTLGFSNTDYGAWPVFAPLWMLFLCGFVTCSGSTGGGIKLVRARLLIKQMFRETSLLVHPRAEIPVRLGSQVIPPRVVFAVLAFMSFYGAALLVVVFLLTLTGLDLLTALSAAIACLNNTGPGLGQVGPATTYAGLNTFQIWVCTTAMLLGRLELFTLVVVLNRRFWRA
ncbi:MAG: TrkH family potassium uptake protein [Gammaproteobacteria bacterium]|nr:TrkH family potassium uptake protein [Gammaproteobacteria bacterium]